MVRSVSCGISISGLPEKKYSIFSNFAELAVAR